MLYFLLFTSSKLVGTQGVFSSQQTCWSTFLSEGFFHLTDGIDASDDHILAVRRGVCEVSVAHRTGGWKGRLAALERGGSPFAL